MSRNVSDKFLLRAVISLLLFAIENWEHLKVKNLINVEVYC